MKKLFTIFVLTLFASLANAESKDEQLNAIFDNETSENSEVVVLSIEEMQDTKAGLYFYYQLYSFAGNPQRSGYDLKTAQPF